MNNKKPHLRLVGSMSSKTERARDSVAFVPVNLVVERGTPQERIIARGLMPEHAEAIMKFHNAEMEFMQKRIVDLEEALIAASVPLPPLTEENDQ